MLAATAYPMSFETGDLLCEEGAESLECYVIEEGEADVTIDSKLVRLGIRPIHGRPYHPQTQGKIERPKARFNASCIRELGWMSCITSMPTPIGGATSTTPSGLTRRSTTSRP